MKQKPYFPADMRQAVNEVLAGATIGAAAERARSAQTYAI